MVEAQCDMVREANNLERIAQAVNSTVGVRVPRTRRDVALSKSVLVMEYIEGTRPLTSFSIPEDNFRTAALLILRQLYQMIFSCGFIHCDLHPGNVHVGAVFSRLLCCFCY
jgi:ubiquinone biosynthesis protein